jgi:urease accessory protein
MYATNQRRMTVRRTALLTVLTLTFLMVTAAPALAHENQVIEFGSFLGGLLHPVLGLDHFLAMVAVGIVSAFIGGRAIWTVPATFVVMMAVGGLAGSNDLGITPGVVELAIAVSVVTLGAVIALDKSLRTSVAMGAVAFFGFFHGYAHGTEIPDIARPLVYAGGFLLGTALIHLLGVLIGDMSRRYPAGRPVLRVVGGVFVLTGALFIGGVI